jgi:predicted DNA-binding transcriptional regulator YafY
LNGLSQLFEISNDGNKDIPGWFWKRDAQKLELPEMEPAVALSFRMVRLFLEKFMPPSTLDDLTPYFQHSDKILNGLQNNQLSDWSQNVALLSRNQPLLSPDIDHELLATIYQALLMEKQIRGHYKPRGEEPRDYTINPLSIVVVDKIIYLVGTLWEYTDIKQFALHRFKSVELLGSDIIEIEDYKLDDYINQGHFEYLVDGDMEITLKLQIAPWLAQHLHENKLSEDQTIVSDDENNFLLQATVKNTHQLRWWLMGRGNDVEVLEPISLRKEFADTFNKLSARYSD